MLSTFLSPNKCYFNECKWLLLSVLKYKQWGFLLLLMVEGLGQIKPAVDNSYKVYSIP